MLIDPQQVLTVVKKGRAQCTFLGEAKLTFIYFSFRVLNLLLYIRVTKFTSRVNTTSHTTNSKMHQSYVPFSKLDVDAVFKILDKEKTIGQYGEKLVLYLEPSPNNQDFISDVIIKTNAPKSLKEKISEDSEID